MTKKAVIFDLDGTLVDSAADLMAAANSVFEQNQIPTLSLAQLRPFIGHGGRVLLRHGMDVNNITISEQQLEEFYQQFLSFYETNIANATCLFPGALALLQRCQAEDFALAICTNKTEKLSHKLISALNLTSYFSSIIGADTIGIAKPDPAPYHATLAHLSQKLQAEIEPSIMIGDSETDILTAHRAGVRVIAVSFGYSAQPISTYQPDYVVDHYDEIWSILLKEFG